MFGLSVNARRSVMCALSPNRRVSVILTTLLTLTPALLTNCLTINKLSHPDIVAKSRVELRPININAFPNDIIRISAPIINEKAVYYIHKPNGDRMKLDINSPKLKNIENEDNELVTRFIKNIKPIISQSNNYDVFSIYKRFQPINVFDMKLSEMEANNFMIGPVATEDHGNWLLSVYTKDLDDEWIELFQVISVTITEYVPLNPFHAVLKLGETLNLSIAFPIPDLESCELVAPRSTFDRLYDRKQIDMKTCEFIVPNVTEQDAGIWRIIGVGKIVYEGETRLFITKDNSTTTW